MTALQPVMDNPKVDLKVHVLLHWPRCFDNIAWMRWAEEEEALHDYVKAAGPDPRDDADNAWKENCKLLEDLYNSETYPVESIRVSDFHLKDLKILLSFARIMPHMIQVSLRMLLYDRSVIEFCLEHGIHFQVYNVLEGILVHNAVAPNAIRHLQKIANDVGKETRKPITAASIVLAWLTQSSVPVIPHTANITHLAENAAVAIEHIPALSSNQDEIIAYAAEACLSGHDLEEGHFMAVTFYADSHDMYLYWIGLSGDESSEVQVKYIAKGACIRIRRTQTTSFARTIPRTRITTSNMLWI